MSREKWAGLRVMGRGQGSQRGPVLRGQQAVMRDWEPFCLRRETLECCVGGGGEDTS